MKKCPKCGERMNWFKVAKPQEYVCIPCETRRADRRMAAMVRREKLLALPLYELARLKGYSDMMRVYPCVSSNPGGSVVIDVTCPYPHLIRKGYKPRIQVIEHTYEMAEDTMRKKLMRMRQI